MISFNGWQFHLICHLIGLCLCMFTMAMTLINRVEQGSDEAGDPPGEPEGHGMDGKIRELGEDSPETPKGLKDMIAGKQGGKLSELVNQMERNSSERRKARHRTEAIYEGDQEIRRGNSFYSDLHMMLRHGPIGEAGDVSFGIGTEEIDRDPEEELLYDRITELASQGMEISQIAENLEMSRGEVELTLKLRRQFCGVYGKERAGYLLHT